MQRRSVVLGLVASAFGMVPMMPSAKAGGCGATVINGSQNDSSNENTNTNTNTNLNTNLNQNLNTNTNVNQSTQTVISKTPSTVFGEWMDYLTYHNWLVKIELDHRGWYFCQLQKGELEIYQDGREWPELIVNVSVKLDDLATGGMNFEL